jgi:hypothetical protein
MMIYDCDWKGKSHVNPKIGSPIVINKNVIIIIKTDVYQYGLQL